VEECSGTYDVLCLKNIPWFSIRSVTLSSGFSGTENGIFFAFPFCWSVKECRNKSQAIFDLTGQASGFPA
jgi:hypothetical protein